MKSEEEIKTTLETFEGKVKEFGLDHDKVTVKTLKWVLE